MPDLPWYEGPTLDTPEKMLEHSASFRADSLVVSYAQGLERKSDDYGLHSLSKAERMVVGVYLLETEINSGGFHSFLEHYSMYVEPAKLGLRSLGLQKLYDLLLEAQAQTDEEALDDLDNAYYSLGLDLAENLIGLANSNAK